MDFQNDEVREITKQSIDRVHSERNEKPKEEKKRGRSRGRQSKRGSPGKQEMREGTMDAEGI